MLEGSYSRPSPPAAARVYDAERLVCAVLREHRPESLGQLRALLADHAGPGWAATLSYVVMRMLNRRELELTTDRRLINRLR